VAERIGGVYIKVEYKVDKSSYKAVTNSLKEIGKQTDNLSKKISKTSKALSSFKVNTTGFSKATADMKKMTKQSEMLANSFKQTGKAAKNIKITPFKMSNQIINQSKGIAGANRQTSTLAGTLGALGKIAVAAFSVRAITNFSKEAISLASDLAEVQNVVDVTFGNLAEDINNFSKTAIKSFGLSETSAKKYASTVGAISKSMGFTTEDALVMGKSITALAADMASFYNLSTDEAFNKIRAGLTGETEPLKQIGVNMSVANLEAYALSQGITKAVSAMSEQEKMLLRNNYLLSVTADAQGDFARNSNSWANQTRILSEQFNQLKATLGTIGIKFLLPIIQGFNQMFTTIQSSANSLANFLGIATNSSVAITSSAGAGVGVVEDIAEGYEEVGKAAKKAKGSVASIDNVIQLSKPEASGSGASGGAGGGNLGVGLASYNFTPKEEEKGKAFGFIDKLKEKLKLLPQEINSISTSLSEIGSNVKPSALNFGESYINYLKQLGVSLIVVGKGMFEGVIGGIDLFLQQNKDRISKSWIGIFDNLSSGTDSATNTVSTVGELLGNFFKLDTTKQGIADAFASIEGLVDGSLLLITGLWEDITGGIDTILQNNKVKFEEFFTNLSEVFSLKMTNIKDIVQGTMDSILKTYDEYIKPFIDKFSEGLSIIVGKILDAYNNHIMPTWKKISEEFNTLYHETIKPFVDKLLEVVGKIVELAGVIWEKFIVPIVGFLVDTFGPAWSTTLNIVWVIVKSTVESVIGVIGGIIDAFGGVIDFVTGVFTGDWKKALEGLKAVFKGIFDAIGGIMMAPINMFVNGWNKLSDVVGVISIPKGVPLVGGLELSLPKLPKPQVALADGGIVTGRTWAEIGEAGPEVVVPLKNSSFTKSFAQDIAREVRGNAGNSQPVQVVFKDNNIFGSDLETIAQLVKRALEKENIRVGGVSYEF
jgi:hypothetical protein